MRRPLLISAAALLLGITAATASFRWTYLSEQEIPGLRLARREASPRTRRLVLLLVDSVPFELAFVQRKLPEIAALRPRGAWGLLRTEDPSMTGQMVYTLATGARPYLYAVLRNWRQNRMRHETFLDVLRRAGLRLELYGDAPWAQMFGDRFDRLFAVPEEGRRPDGRPYRWQNPLNDLDHRVLVHLDEALRRPRFDVLIWHIHGTDLVMHKYLRDSRLTALKLRFADRMVREIVRQLDDGTTTFLILSDHGCAANGRHGYEDPDARRAFYLLFGRGVRPIGRRDLRQVDIAPTVTALFGWSPPAPSAGRPAVEALALNARDRAAALVSAARQRAAYLTRRNRGKPAWARGPTALLRQAEQALRAGETERASRQATAYLRAARTADLQARRERGWLVPGLTWLGVLGLLLGLGWGLSRSLPPPPAPPPRAGLAIAAAGLAGLWAAGLAAAVWAGRAFNDHIDLWSPSLRGVFWAAVALALGCLLWLVGRPMKRLYSRSPVTALWVGAFALAVLPGYFQGLYMPGLLLVLAVALAWRRSLEDRRALAFWLVSGALLGISLVWAYHWRPHFFLLREAFEGRTAALAAAAAVALAAGVLLLVGRRPGEGPVTPRHGLAAAALVGVVALRHLLVPLPSILRFPSVGDQILADAPLRAVFVVFGGLAWALAWKIGLRGPRAAAVGALALLACWGSSFEAVAFSGLAVALAPFGQVRQWDAARAPEARWTRVLLAAVLLVAARVALQQPHEFYFNFTAVHDLFRFAPDTDTELGALAIPVLLRYVLPSLVLVPLLLGRLAPAERRAAVLLAAIAAGARALHLLVTVRLTLDQLYGNWRGVGELILTVGWVASVALALLLYELGGALAARWAAPRGGRPAHPADPARKLEPSHVDVR